MKKILTLLLAVILLSSCSQWTAPPYTSVDKMLRVESNMRPEEVNQTLGIKPYNMLHKNSETSIFEYHYRLKDRDVNNITNYNDFIHLEKSQVGGKSWYTKPSKFYVMYEKDRLKSLITENGLNNTDYLLLKNNNLILVSQSDLVDFDLWEDVGYLHKIDNTSKLKASNSFSHSVLYMANVPYGYIGLKYVFGKKFGGYVSGAMDPDWGEFTYATGGFVYKPSSKMGYYLGLGAGPYHEIDYWSSWYDEYLYIGSFVMEAGTLINMNKFVLDLGVGANIDEGAFGKIGFGYNF